MTSPGETPDWTADPLSGRSNCSPEYRRLVGEVEQLIRSQAHFLIAGRADQVAGLIMAQLAHVHHLAPATVSRTGGKQDGHVDLRHRVRPA